MMAGVVLVECCDGRGRMQFRERFTTPNGSCRFTIGRSLNADVTVDDEHVAPVHAICVIAPDGAIAVSDNGSLNGFWVGGKRYHNAHEVGLPDGRFQVGRTKIRIRTHQEVLAPERADHFHTAEILRDPRWLASFAALVFSAQYFYSNWIGAPEDYVGTAAAGYIGIMAFAGIWIAVWGLLSRVMQGEWRWLKHSAIALGIVSAAILANGALNLFAYMFFWPDLVLLGWVSGLVALGAILYLHVIHASALNRARAGLLAGACSILLVCGFAWFADRTNSRDVNYIDVGMRLYPPWLRLSSAASVDEYFESLRTLREKSDKRRLEWPPDDPDEEIHKSSFNSGRHFVRPGRLGPGFAIWPVRKPNLRGDFVNANRFGVPWGRCAWQVLRSTRR